MSAQRPQHGVGLVDELHRRSLEDPEGFWGEAARAIDWTVAPQTVLDR